MPDELDIYDLPIEAMRSFARAVVRYRKDTRIVSRNDMMSISASHDEQLIRFTYKRMSVAVRPHAPIIGDGIWSVVGDLSINSFIAFMYMVASDGKLFLDLGDDYVKLFSTSPEFRSEVLLSAVVGVVGVDEEEDLENQLFLTEGEMV